MHGQVSDPHHTSPHGMLACYQVLATVQMRTDGQTRQNLRLASQRPCGACVWSWGRACPVHRASACGGRVGCVRRVPSHVRLPPCSAPWSSSPTSSPWGVGVGARARCSSVRTRAVDRQQHLQQHRDGRCDWGGGRVLHTAANRPHAPPAARPRIAAAPQPHSGRAAECGLRSAAHRAAVGGVWPCGCGVRGGGFVRPPCRWEGCDRLCRWGGFAQQPARLCVCVTKRRNPKFQHAFTPPGVADYANADSNIFCFFCTRMAKKSQRQGPGPPCFRGFPAGRLLPWLAVQPPPLPL